MRLFALLAVSLVATSASAAGARKSSADQRGGLTAGDSRAFGRKLAKHLAVLSSAPTTFHSENPGRALREAVRGALQTGGLTGVGYADGGVQAEISSLADEYGAPHLQTTEIALRPITSGRDGLAASALVRQQTTTRRQATTTSVLAVTLTQPHHEFPGRRVVLDPTAPVVSTTHRRSLDVTDSGHASIVTDTAETPSAGMAFADRQRFVVQLGQGRPNVHAPNEVELAPAAAARRVR